MSDRKVIRLKFLNAVLEAQGESGSTKGSGLLLPRRIFSVDIVAIIMAEEDADVCCSIVEEGTPLP